MENNFSNSDGLSSENFRMFYQLQYDRIDKLETRRENFCNYVITISAGFFFVAITKGEYIDLAISVIFVSFMLFINIAAILFIAKTRPFIKMHQKRAELAALKFAIELNDIREEAGKIESDNDFWRRSRIYSYLHFLIIIFVILSFIFT